MNDFERKKREILKEFSKKYRNHRLVELLAGAIQNEADLVKVKELLEEDDKK